MFEVMHVTPTRNLESIMRNGLIPSKPTLRHQDQIFRDDNVLGYDGKCSYSFVIDDNVDKYTKDSVFWHAWGMPRNRFVEDEKTPALFGMTPERFSEKFNNHEFGPELFDKLEIPKEEDYTVLKIELEFSCHPNMRYMHGQTPDMNPIWANMPEEFAHTTKELMIISYTVKPCFIKKIGEARFEVDVNNKISVRVKA